MNRQRISWRLLLALALVALPALGLAHGLSEADRQAMLDGGYLRYVWLGATHMLTGYDHLLFVYGIIFFLTGFRDVVRTITAFTLGHSITLVFATIYGITANYYLVDAVIALSVCYKGFDNAGGFQKYFQRDPPNLLWVVFGFGLVHGFGLSTRLQQLPLGDEGLVWRILSFNVGVEIGQVLALGAMVVLIAGWRKTRSFAQFATVSNAGLVAAGLFLFAMQMHGYTHTRHPDDFGFAEDNHAHSHEKLEREQAARAATTHDTID